MSDIPEWAVKRATDLTNEAMRDGSWLPIGGHASAAFARYIAEHEEPPVDPLLIEAREIVKAHHSFMPKHWVGFQVIDGANGGLGDDQTAPVANAVSIALAALKRGMELAREEKP